MTYATREDLVDRFGAEEIAKLGDEARVAAALADAAAEIDAVLAAAYRLPPGDGPWPLLLRIQCDLARGRLYDEAPPERVTGNAEAARERLGGIAEGTVRLVDAQGNAAERSAAGAVIAGDRAFPRETLEGL